MNKVTVEDLDLLTFWMPKMLNLLAVKLERKLTEEESMLISVNQERIDNLEVASIEAVTEMVDSKEVDSTEVETEMEDSIEVEIEMEDRDSMDLKVSLSKEKLLIFNNIYKY